MEYDQLATGRYSMGRLKTKEQKIKLQLEEFRIEILQTLLVVQIVKPWSKKWLDTQLCGVILSLDLFKGKGIDEMASCNLFQPTKSYHFMFEQDIKNDGSIFLKGEWTIRSEWELGAIYIFIPIFCHVHW